MLGVGMVVAYWIATVAGMGSSAAQHWWFVALLVLPALVVAERAACITVNRTAWRILAVGLALWTLAFVWQSASDLAGDERPGVSGRDLLWLSLYPAATAAFLLAARRRLRPRRLELTLDTLTLTLVIAALVVAIVVPPVARNAVGLSQLAYSTTITYTIADAILLACALTGASLFGWRLRSPWVHIAIATTFLLLADGAWATEVTDGTWRFGLGANALFPAFSWGVATAAVTAAGRWRTEPAAAPDLRIAASASAAAVVAFALLVANEWLDLAPAAIVLAALAIVISSHRPARSVMAQLRLAREAEVRDELTADVRRALALGEIEVHFQPILVVGDERVCGAEALVRWRRDGRLVPPDSFLPVVERCEVMPALTDHVLDRALAAVGEWRRAGHHLGVSVNLAALDVSDPRLADRVAAALTRHGVPAPLLTLEMTETAAVEDMDTARLVLGALDRIGVSLSVDDFGTGHSSLARLATFALDELKIDRSFTGDPSATNRSIVATTIELAHALGLGVVAEGVETTETLRELKALGCDRAQGFLFARPLAQPEFLGWLESRSDRRVIA